MRRSNGAWKILGTAAACLVLATSCAGTGSDSAGSPFEGETIEVVLGSSPGGGFDTYVRAIQPFLEEELGATVEIQYRPGAGGLLAWNQVASARPDGTTIGFNQAGPIVMNLIAGVDEGVEFDMAELTYFGNIVGAEFVFYSGPDSEFATVDDVLRNDRQFGLGSPSTSSSAYIFWALMLDTYDLRGSLDDVVTGFDGTDELFLSATRGDIDGSMSPSTSAVSRFESGDLVPLAAIDRERNDLLPDVPTIFESDPTPDQESTMNAFIDATALTRLFFGPPDIGDEETRAIRTALRNVAEDEEFRRQATDQQLPINFTDGEAARQLLLDVLNNPPESFRRTLEAALASS